MTPTTVPSSPMLGGTSTKNGSARRCHASPAASTFRVAPPSIRCTTPTVQARSNSTAPNATEHASSGHISGPPSVMNCISMGRASGSVQRVGGAARGEPQMTRMEEQMTQISCCSAATAGLAPFRLRRSPEEAGGHRTAGTGNGLLIRVICSSICVLCGHSRLTPQPTPHSARKSLKSMEASSSSTSSCSCWRARASPRENTRSVAFCTGSRPSGASAASTGVSGRP